MSPNVVTGLNNDTAVQICLTKSCKNYKPFQHHTDTFHIKQRPNFRENTIIFQGSVATCLRCGGCCHMGFVANFIRFVAVQKFWKSVKIWRSCRELKGGNFFLRHSVYSGGLNHFPRQLIQRMSPDIKRQLPDYATRYEAKQQRSTIGQLLTFIFTNT